MSRNRVGRPSEAVDAPGLFTADRVETIYELCLLGLSDEKISQVIGITQQTLIDWKRRYPWLAQRMLDGKELADAQVARSMYQRARGYDLKSEKIFCGKDGEIIRAETVEHYPADVTAAHRWLGSRQPALWAQKVVHDVNVRVEASDLSDEDLERIVAGRAQRDREDHLRKMNGSSVH